ncbi:major facilitator superfamily transporter [Paraphaeosphaeria sporulosa]
MAPFTFILLALSFVSYLAWKIIKAVHCNKTPSALKKLPGPKGYPFIGSVPDVPEKNVFIKFAEWGKEYGPIYQVNLAGTNHVWISSDQIAKDLLAKKGSIYSDRPHIPGLIDDNRTSAQYLPLLSKNDGWTRQRKFANVIMRESEEALFHRYPEIEAKRMLVELLEEPDRYNHTLESFVARVTCRLAWGRSEASDELKQRARELLLGVSPTGSFANKLPFLMALPDWLSPAKAWERRRARTERFFFQIMQGEVEKDAREEKAPQSWMKIFLDRRSKWGFKDELEGAYAVGMHGIAGALTIAAPMQTFCLAMCFYPQYLPMLHEELDRVCGERLPVAEDRPNLPFLRAVIRECLRWRPPVPTGIPHELTQDDEYNGYHIPKGSVMHPLEWAIARDPSMFPDPEAFNPLRWVEPGWPTYQEPLTQFPTIINCSQFGYGRRLCQGQTVADEDLLIGIGSMAWMFDMSKEHMPAAANVSSHSIGMNEHASISQEELDTGIEKFESCTMEDVLLSKYTYPGAFPVGRDEGEEKRIDKGKELAEFDPAHTDPTLDFSTLLIAKPLPFKFELRARDGERADRVRKLFQEGCEKGEYKESREFWGEDQGKGKPCGWGKMWLHVAYAYRMHKKPFKVALPKTRDFSIDSQAYLNSHCQPVTLLNTNFGRQHSSDAPPLTISTLARSLEQCFACIPRSRAPDSNMLGFTATRIQVATYLLGVALFSISFLVFLNSSISFVITQRIGQAHNVGDAVGTLGFADELVALVACPAWGLLSDRVGVRSVAVMGYAIVGVSLWVFMAAKNVYPQLLLARLLFSLGATATATMVTAILPTMTVVQIVQDPRTPRRRVNGASHALAPSISSELTITPARFQSRSPPRDDDTIIKKDTAASTSQLAGLVGMFTGCGALVALLIFLPLPTRFGRGGAEPAAAVADAFYVVGSIAIVVALGCFFGLRHLPGEEDKSWKRLYHTPEHKFSDPTPSRQRILSYPRLFLESIRLGYQSPTIGLGYVGGFVARASSVAISLFIPLFTNTYFLRTGQCRATDPADPADIKNSCPQAYKLAAMLTGISQLIALLSAPLFGYLSGRYRKHNLPLMLAAAAGIAGYSAFGSLASPDPKSKDGSGGIFAIVALLGISQIGAIVCSLALLGRGINADDSASHAPLSDEILPSNGHPSAGATPPRSPTLTPSSEDAPLLGTNYSRPASSSGPASHTHLKGAIAGTYSLLGGFGILLLTKAGGALFDSRGPGAPFYMMAGFNGLLLAVGVVVAAGDVYKGRQVRVDRDRETR